MLPGPKFDIEKLIPVLTSAQKQEIYAYYAVYEKYEEAFRDKIVEDLKDHPVFGKLIREIPKEVSEQQSKVSRALQKDAIMNDNWRPYMQHQVAQGYAYAQMGLEFKSWFELVAMVKDYITPYLYEEYKGGPELLWALNGMNRFMDMAMGAIGEAYIEEKNGIIKDARDRLSSIYETIADAVFVLEVENGERYKVSSVNKAFQTFTGIRYETIVGKYVRDILPTKGLDVVLAGYREAVDGKKVARWEQVFENTAKPLFCDISIAPYFDEAGNCIRLVGVMHDISERKKLAEEEKRALELTVANKLLAYQNENKEKRTLELSLANDELKNAEARLIAANEELEAFSYSVSHDLRAPLRAVNGYAQMLKEDYNGQLDDKARRLMDNIMKNAEKMGQLIDDLLTFSRLGRRELQLHNIRMQDMVSGLWKELKPEQDHRDIEIHIKELLPAQADNVTIKQVWLNLISNAIKYSKQKAKAIIEIGSEIKGNEIMYYVKDNGAGFDMRYVDKLFGVFQRLHSEREFEGTGVGLAIVQRIIAKHGGRVWATGKVNEGASFYFTLNKS
jgi:PAS domain S-box-containing protein